MLDWKPLKSKFDGAGALSPRTLRAKVPGGWLVAISFGIDTLSFTFYPDPEHRWDGTSLPL